MFKGPTFLHAENKGPDQTVQMRRLRNFIVRTCQLVTYAGYQLIFNLRDLINRGTKRGYVVELVYHHLYGLFVQHCFYGNRLKCLIF